MKPEPENIRNQQELLAAHRHTLAHYLKQQALLGSAYIPPSVAHGIYESRQEIARIKAILRSWHIAAQDLPDDVEGVHPLFDTVPHDPNDRVYRFRAECEHDVDMLRALLGQQVKRIAKLNEAPFPDNEVEIHVALSLEELRDVMRKVEDGHVMVQTVAPRDIYTGERDYDIQ
jgi:hypothetical protein